MKTPDQPYDGRNRKDGQEWAPRPRPQYPQQDPASPEPGREGGAGGTRRVLAAAGAAVTVVIATAVGLSVWQPWSQASDGTAQAEPGVAPAGAAVPGPDADAAASAGSDPEAVDAVYAAFREQSDAAPLRLRAVGATRPGAAGGAFGIQEGWIGADGTQLITMNAGYGRSTVLYEDGGLYINIHELSPRFSEAVASLGRAPVREDTWYRMPVEGMGGFSTILSMSATDPEAAARVVEGTVRSARDLGETTVDGVSVHKYKVVYDMQKRMDNVFAFFGDAVGDEVLASARAILSDPQFTAFLEDQSEATLWIDEQGRIRRQVSGDGSGLEFFGFGGKAPLPAFDRATAPDFPI